MGKMKALFTHKKEDGTREKFLVDIDDCGKATGNMILCKTLYTGVTNGTERNDLIKGNYSTPDENLPAPWGYQNVGEVIEVGPDVKRVKVGDVVFSSANHTEYSSFDDNFLFCTLPDSVDRKEAALYGMASVAMRTMRHADVRLGEKVLIIGAGFIGQIAAQIARAMGGRVTIVDIDQGRLDTAMEIGAVEKAINTSGDGWEKNIEDFSFDVIADLAGVPDMIDQMVKAAKMRGRIMIIAGRFDVKYNFNTGQGHEINIKQNSHFDNDDLEKLCYLHSIGDVKIAPLMKDVVPVSEAKEIYDTLRDEPQKLRGTVFIW